MGNYYYNLGMFFSDIAGEYANNTLLQYADQSYTYGEIYNMIERLCAVLIDEGLQAGDVIAVAHDKSALSYGLMLAALRLGMPYVNIDTCSPPERIISILNTCQAKCIFFDQSSEPVILGQLKEESTCRVIIFSEPLLNSLPVPDTVEQNKRMLTIDGSTIAYIMFTSGSTGVPKGVAVTHENVLHFIAWGKSRFNVNSADNIANVSPMYFDNSVFDFYVGVFSGAKLTPVNRKLLADPYALVKHIQALNCTVWFSVPSLLIYMMAMKAFSANLQLHLRLIIFGGEGFPKFELKKLYDMFSPGAVLVNVYGPTECTCICSAHTITVEDFTDMTGLATLGRLNQNFDYQILSDDGTETDVGELCLIGPNVAAGYFNDTVRTDALFKAITQPNRFMKRMYLTGDIVKRDGEKLHFICRKDNQIKHMGYRIELDEIEHAFSKHPDVNQVAVVYQRAQHAYGKIVAFVASECLINERELFDCVKKYLPEYMIPSKIITMHVLPKNSNGKVDRQKLQTTMELI